MSNRPQQPLRNAGDQQMTVKETPGDRAYKARGRTRTVPLTKGKEALVDEADYYMVSLHKWQAFRSSTGTRLYARRQCRIPGSAKKATVSLAHVIAGAKPHEGVRHLNGDTLDCRRENLAVVGRRGKMPIDPNTGRRVQRPGASMSRDADPLDEEYLP